MTNVHHVVIGCFSVVKATRDRTPHRETYPPTYVSQENADVEWAIHVEQSVNLCFLSLGLKESQPATDETVECKQDKSFDAVLTEKCM